MTAWREIDYAVADRVATVTLNRPDRLNAWTATMETELRAAMAGAARDDDVRVILLTGAGRGFCAGADMSMLQSSAGESPEEAAARRREEAELRVAIPNRLDVPGDFSRRYCYFPSVPKPVIAAVNGPAAGLGMVMSLYCDVRLAGDAAFFTTAFSRRGLIAEHGIDYMLVNLVGPAAALDMLLSARRVGADEALQRGLVNAVFPAESFAADARAYALELAGSVSPRSMRVMKEQVWRTLGLRLGDAVRIANEEMIASLASEDFREGVAHFVEQRAPAFTGR